MKVSQRTVSRALKGYREGNWRLIPIKIDRITCSAISDPFPERGPFKATQVWREPKGNLLLYLVKDENSTLLAGDRISFSAEEVDRFLDDLDQGPLIWEIDA